MLVAIEGPKTYYVYTRTKILLETTVKDLVLGFGSRVPSGTLELTEISLTGRDSLEEVCEQLRYLLLNALHREKFFLQ
jgi:hypothetical protein